MKRDGGTIWIDGEEPRVNEPYCILFARRLEERVETRFCCIPKLLPIGITVVVGSVIRGGSTRVKSGVARDSIYSSSSTVHYEAFLQNREVHDLHSGLPHAPLQPERRCSMVDKWKNALVSVAIATQ